MQINDNGEQANGINNFKYFMYTLNEKENFKKFKIIFTLKIYYKL